MRPLNLAVPAMLLLVVSACAPTAGSGTYVDELRELSDSCEARGGILVPNGQQSGRPIRMARHTEHLFGWGQARITHQDVWQTMTASAGLQEAVDAAQPKPSLGA